MLLAGCVSAAARDFDFYVLALSWSPSYCAAEGADADRSQCSGQRPYAFVVHGLWPQYESGFPEFCATSPRLPQGLIGSMLDLMPSPRLVVHQWKKHGTCSGLDQRNYFEHVRAAARRVSVPAEFRSVDDWRMVAPGVVESAFVRANPGLDAGSIAVTCDGRHLREVRVCLTRDLDFRPCPEIDRRACRAGRVAMPPVRGN